MAHQHAGAGQGVGDLQLQRRAVVGVVGDDQLVAVVLPQGPHPGRHLAGAGDHQHGEVGVALGAGTVELAQGLGTREAGVLGLEDDTSPRRPGAAVDAHDDVAGLAARFLYVPHRRGVVALGGGDLLDGVGDLLLEGASLGAAALALGRHLLELLALGAQALDLEPGGLELVHHRAQLLGVGVGGLLGHRQLDAVKLGQRVLLALGQELGAQLVLHLGRDVAHDVAHLVLDGVGRGVGEVALQGAGHVAGLGAKGLLELLVQALGDAPGSLDELGVEVAGGTLELGLDEVGLGAGLLAVQDAGTDLDRVEHELYRVRAGLLAL